MSLASLQYYRKQLEEQVKLELARVTQSLQDAERAHEVLLQDQRTHEERYRRETQAGITIEQLVQWQSHFEALHAATEQAARTVAHWAHEWEVVQARVVAARQERETLDRLADRYQEEAEIAERRRDQTAMDEAAHYQNSLKGDRAA